MTPPAAHTEADHRMITGKDQMSEHQTIVERSIERELRERLRWIDDYGRADREQRERIEHDVREGCGRPGRRLPLRSRDCPSRSRDVITPSATLRQ
jgi:hypothetical protein